MRTVAVLPLFLLLAAYEPAQNPATSAGPGTITGTVAGTQVCLSVTPAGLINVFTNCSQVDEVLLDASTPDSQDAWPGGQGTYIAGTQNLNGPYLALRPGKSFSFGDANARNKFWVCPAPMAPIAGDSSPATVDSTNVHCTAIPQVTVDNMLKFVDKICASNPNTCLPAG